MNTVNSTNYNVDLTVRVFDNFYSYEANIPVDEYDAVHSFFLESMSDRTAAGNFTVSLFRISQETGIPAMTLLQGFQGTTGVDLTANLAYYLNMIRNRATLLGVGVPTQPNYYAARCVVQ
jgi:hypothetical protein